MRPNDAETLGLESADMAVQDYDYLPVGNSSSNGNGSALWAFMVFRVSNGDSTATGFPTASGCMMPMPFSTMAG